MKISYTIFFRDYNVGYFFYEKDMRNHHLVIYINKKKQKKIIIWVTHYPTQHRQKINGFTQTGLIV